MNILLIVIYAYLVAAFITWLYQGYVTGVQFTQNVRAARQHGQNPMFQLNYVNIFFQGLCWPSFWASTYGEYVDKKKNGDPADIKMPPPPAAGMRIQ